MQWYTLVSSPFLLPFLFSAAGVCYCSQSITYTQTHYSHTHTPRDNLEFPINLNMHVFCLQEEPEYVGKTMQTLDECAHPPQKGHRYDPGVDSGTFLLSVSAIHHCRYLEFGFHRCSEESGLQVVGLFAGLLKTALQTGTVQAICPPGFV